MKVSKNFAPNKQTGLTADENPFLYKIKSSNDSRERIILTLSGIAVGIINGLFGGGGGMLVVPILTFLLKKPTRVAHATAILIILPITLCSAIVYLIMGNFDLLNGSIVGVGVLTGGIIGALLLGKLNSKIIGGIFALLMLVAGVNAGFF